MMVVVVILAIIAGMVVPKLAGNDKREFKVTVEKVADLLTMYAQHESLGQKVVGVFYDHSSHAIELMALDSESGAVGELTDWRVDRYVHPVQLPAFMEEGDIEFFVDGDRYDASYIPISNQVGQDRPTIEIGLRGAGEHAQLILYPYGVAPELTMSYDRSIAARTRIDLDVAGRNREDW